MTKAGPVRGERKRIRLRDVRTLPLNSEIWDAAVAGFSARRQRSDAIAYVVLYRTPQGRGRRFTIGRHGALGPLRRRGRKRGGYGVAGGDLHLCRTAPDADR
jgi:hypothetical protein